MEVTGYEVQKKNKDRISIYVDGKYEFSLSTEKFLEFKICKGLKLTNAEIEKMKVADEGNAAFSRLLFIVQYGMKTEKELRDKLTSCDFSEEAIDFAIEKGREYNYVDDIYYVESYIRTKAIPSKWGEQKIISKLYQKGIDIEIIKEKINKLYGEEEKYQNAIEFAEKKLCSFNKSLDAYKKKQKLYSFLAGRGFSYEIIKRVLNEVFE